MISIIKSVAEWKELRKSDSLKNKTIGFVPTMGALHEGHLSLIEKSKNENEITVVSIFVNPPQFNDPKDLEKYPRTYEDDLQKLNRTKTDYLFYPSHNELYADKFRYEINEKEFSQILCGAHRPGHFTGVLTIVMKLLNIVKADNAYFGEKDYQQYLLIKGMVDTFFMDTKIIPCPIVREKDGLAMSSRNMLLSKQERILAPTFFEILSKEKNTEEIIAKLAYSGFKVDYVDEVENRRYAAVYLGNVRLIDNVKI
ncbi:MAG: pantoate--beta-alanine ligase [Bacteroidetes bacterium]|nr:pantoate--beta-alanine ligase [Bacteroidota bacterium]